MKLIAAWIWESLENLPLIIGFVVAARVWLENPVAGLLILIIGMALGVLVTRSIEPKLHNSKHQVGWVSVVANFLLFVLLAIPFLSYFHSVIDWLNWKTDLLGGLVAGIILTLVQSSHWSGKKTRMLLHGVAMTVTFPVIMLSLRYIIHLDSWVISLFFTLLLTLFASILIVLIDYQELYRNSK